MVFHETGDLGASFMVKIFTLFNGGHGEREQYDPQRTALPFFPIPYSLTPFGKISGEVLP